MSKGTPPRSLRVPPEVWEAALLRARTEGATLTAIVVDALRKYAEGDRP